MFFFVAIDARTRLPALRAKPQHQALALFDGICYLCSLGLGRTTPFQRLRRPAR